MPSKKTNASKEIVYKPIGIIHSVNKNPDSTPIQPVFAAGCSGYAKILPEFNEGLMGLEGFSHVYLIYHFNRSASVNMSVKPYLSDRQTGLFATRSPNRPNPLGISLVKLERIIGNIIYFDELDVLDSTPLLDIKPFVGRFDNRENYSCGWIEELDEDCIERLGRRSSE